MSMLQEGPSGAQVEELQKRLKELGFNSDQIDGDFGPAIKAALIAFQRSESRLANGIAGPRTLAVLGLADDDNLPSVIPGTAEHHATTSQRNCQWSGSRTSNQSTSFQCSVVSRRATVADD